MKKLRHLFYLFIFLFSACKTTYIDERGNRNPTHNTLHINKVHPHGFYAHGKWVNPCCQARKITAQK